MTELPVIMASLEVDDKPAPTVETEEKKEAETRCVVAKRALRELAQRTCQQRERESLKRRSCLRPMKLNISQKRFHPLKVKSLATIYEEPIVKKNGTVVHMGQTEIRKINFNVISKDKIRKRKAKMKEVISSTNLKNRKLSMDEFLPRLEGLLGSSSTGNSDINVMTSLESCEME